MGDIREKARLQAFVEATHNMDLARCANAVTMQAVVVASAQDKLYEMRGTLDGYRQALKAKREALGQ